MKKDIKNKLLNNHEIIKWCFVGVTKITLKDTSNKDKLQNPKKIEKKWGNDILGTKNAKQWTTRLCENLVAGALIELGKKNVRKTEKKKSSVRNKKYSPDLECDNFVYEVKGRS